MAADTTLLKTRIAMLWVFTIFAGLLYMTAMEQWAGASTPRPTSPALSLWAAGSSLGLFIMPVLSVTLRDSWNRWANILMGFFFTLAGIVGTASTVLTYPADITLLSIAATVAPGLILYYAYRWPKG